MSYVDIDAPSYSSHALKKLFTDSFSGGVRLDNTQAFSSDGAFCGLVNMRNTVKGLCTRNGQKKFDGDIQISGTLHSFTKHAFYSKTVIHAGSGLYTVDAENGEISEIFSSMPDKNSFMVEFGAKLYIYSDLLVFSVDKDFNAKEEYPDAPIFYHNYPSYSSTSQIYKVSDAVFNLLSPRISISYKCQDETFVCHFPIKCDMSRKIEIRNKDVLLSEDEYTIKEKYILLNKSVVVENDNDIVVSFYPEDPGAIGFVDIFSKLTLGISYGGSVISGTRVFATGNPDEPGKYYISELLNPLCFKADNYEILGNGSEAITGFERQYGYLMIFTENSVLRMSYTLADSEPVFSVKEINSQIGCDCPGTIELIDNRVVFANSHFGVYIIDSTENYDEQNIKPISANINTGSGMGLLDLGSEKLKKACSIDFGRSYCLSVDDKIYIWDYNERAYSDSGNYSASQKKLVWYIYDGISADCLFEGAGELCAYCSDAEKGVSVFRKGEGDFGQNISSWLEIGSIDFSQPTEQKKVCAVRLEFSGEVKEPVILTTFADGEKYFKCSLGVVRKGEKSCELGAHLPNKKLKRFGMKLEFCGQVSLKSITLEWKNIG